jgi:hypothetical protein
MKLTFEEWISFVFNHEVSNPEWYWDTDIEQWVDTQEVTVDYLTRLFKQPLRYVGPYSDKQLNQGFWYLVGNGSEYMFALLDEKVPLESRLHCIQSFADLFTKLFAEKCSPHLSHFDGTGACPLNLVCYMWWDIIPIGGRPEFVSQNAIDEECLRVMEKVLHLDSIACQESALHGLGHWHLSYSQRVENAIDRFLVSHPNLRPELLRYAKSARRGYVQ